MSSGRDVWMESWATSDEKPFYTVKELNEKFAQPEEVVYYVRVNGDKITWGHMHQIDDNIKIVFDKNTNTFTINKI
jgi:small nuclear ribonucleoprotein (snRNP)-like protein